MRKFAVFVPVLALLVLFASSSSAVAQQSLSITIGRGRDEASGTGTATLTAVGNQTRVVLAVSGTNPEMLAHIHADACPGVGAVIFPLTNPVNGQSTTTIDAPLTTVLAQGRSINLHKSPTDGNTYVGCGNLFGAAAGAGGVGQVPGAAPAVQVPRALPATGDLGALAPLFALAGAGLVGAGFGIRRFRRTR